MLRPQWKKKQHREEMAIPGSITVLIHASNPRVHVHAQGSDVFYELTWKGRQGNRLGIIWHYIGLTLEFLT